ncbi:MAG: GntR family transcriptional regulator [Acidimicrobiia bacterium]
MAVVAQSTQNTYERIRQAIVEGELSPGQRLVEQRLVEQFEAASRTPVREALRRLEAEGLIEAEPNKGARVRSLSMAEIDDLYELRARLEGYAAALAAARASEEQIAELDRSIELFAEAINSELDLSAIRKLNTANQTFHYTIVEAANHARLGQLLSRAVDVPLVFKAFQRFSPEQVERSFLFHQLIRDAVAAGEAARAERLTQEHILQGRDVLLGYLDGDLESTLKNGTDGGTNTEA